MAIACDIHDGIKLLRQRLDKTGPEPALDFARAHIRLADPVIGNRQLPVGFRDFVRNDDRRIRLLAGNACFKAFITNSVTISPMLTASRDNGGAGIGLDLKRDRPAIADHRLRQCFA